MNIRKHIMLYIRLEIIPYSKVIRGNFIYTDSKAEKISVVYCTIEEDL